MRTVNLEEVTYGRKQVWTVSENDRVVPEEIWTYADIPDASAFTFEQDVHQVFVELEELLLSKHVTYGSKNISGAPGGAENGLRVRMWDKLARLNNLLEHPSVDPGDESFTDTLKDLANYAVIFMLVRNRRWPK